MDPARWGLYPLSMPLATFAVALDSDTVLVLITLVVAPIAAIAFARSGPAWERIGRGPLAIEEAPPAESSDRAAEEALLRAEVGQHVRADNERRRRRGEAQLDVEEETERRLADLIGSGR